MHSLSKKEKITPEKRALHLVENSMQLNKQSMGSMSMFNNEDHHGLLNRFEDYLLGGNPPRLSESEFFKLMEYYEGEFHFDRALEVVELALAHHSFTSEFYIRKAQLLLRQEREEQAIETLDRAAIYAPTSLGIQLIRADVYTQLELYSDALSMLDRLKTDASKEELSDIFLHEAKVYEKLRQYDRMFFALKAALQENPHNDAALHRIWMAVEVSKKYEVMVDLCEEVIDAHPYSYMAWFQLANAHAYLCNHEEAIDAYEFAYTIKEDFEHAYRDCAEVCFEIRQFHKALKCYSEAINHIEPDSHLFLRIGQCYWELNDTTIAKTFFEKAIELEPIEDEAHYYLGRCYAKEQQWKPAIHCYIEALNCDNKREEYYAGLAEAYFKMENLAKAEKFFRIAADIAPDVPEYWLRYAMFLIETKEPDRAIGLLKEADLYTISAHLVYCKVVCYLLIGQRREAFFHLGEALLDFYPEHTALYDLLPALQGDKEIKAMIAAYLPI